MKPVWIIDDDRSIRWVFEKALTRENIAFKVFASVARSPAGAVGIHAAGGGQRHPHARRFRPRIAAKAEGEIPHPASHHHDRIFGPRKRGGRIPGRCVRIPAQTFRRGPGSRPDPPRDGGEPASGRRCRSGAGITRNTRPGAVHAGSIPRHRATHAVARDRPDQWRIRHRQGTGGARAAPAQPARTKAIHRHQHGGNPEGSARIRVVRSRTRRLHRRAGDAARPLRTGRRRHAVSGRDRRHAARPADAPAAGAVGRTVLPRRRAPADQGQRAHHRSNAPGPGKPGQAGYVPRRSIPPVERDPVAPSGAARTPRRHSAAGQAFPAEKRA